MATSDLALLVTKLYVPRVRSAYVSRRGLLAALDAGIDHKLILVAAGAGSGKTTLLAEWSATRDDAVCWLSLDREDNDPARFLAYLVAAIQTRYPQTAKDLLAALQSPQPPAPDNALPVLINQIAEVVAASSTRLILIFDDYQVIENQVIHEALRFLLDHLPPRVTLILLTRSDPPLPLARLRAKNDLLDIRAAALRFSDDEAEHFLNGIMGLKLPRDAVQALDAHAEGWIAGLQLAALAMQAAPGDKQAFVREFTGSNRFILDYLIEEVLSRQPELIRRFLLQTSFLRRLTGALCDSIRGSTDGQAMLEHLERNHLFVIPLDQSQRWYRYHHLFADLLQARFQAEGRDQLSALRQRAAHWHEQNGLPEEAISYALDAADYEYAAQLIVGPAATVAQRGAVATLLGWYRTFPPDFVRQHPRLGLHFGLAFALNGRWAEAETLLGYIEQDYRQALPAGEFLMFDYLIAVYHWDTAHLSAIAAQIDTYEQPDALTRGILALIVGGSGDLQRATRLMAEVLADSQRQGDPALLLTAWFQQCRLLTLFGSLHQAHDLCQRALQQFGDGDSYSLPMVSFVHSALGRIYIEWNQLDQAEDHLAQAMALSERTGFVTGMMSSVALMQAEVSQAKGDADAASERLDAATTYANRYDPPQEAALLNVYGARVWLAQGNLTRAAEWLTDSQKQGPTVTMFYVSNIDHVTEAQLLLAQRKPDEAISLLTRLNSQPRNLLTVEILCLLALARQAKGDSVNALLTLEQALVLAEPENRVRVFLNLGAPMAKLLARYCESHPDHEFVSRVLAAGLGSADNRQSNPLAEPLSNRELDVLRLIVAGQSNDEIAQSLTLALSTVKWYINVLYGKLHVKTRSQAIARAHDLKLL